MFIDPQEILGHLTGHAASKVGDFGAGSGTYAYHLTERFPDGSVYALDILPQHIEAMSKKKIKNLFPVMADIERHIPLRDSLLDAALVVNTLHALTEREKFMTELNRVVAPGGQVLIADWAASFNDMGPRPERVVGPGDAVRLVQAYGFSSGPMLPAGSHHYAFVAQKL